MSHSKEILKKLTQQLKGTLHTGKAIRILYATDASAYREMPLAVAIPDGIEDLKTLIQFANTHQIGLIPRTAGTSLAGQVVGNGIVVDVSHNFNQIIELNTKDGWVKVQPGVVRDELNHYLKPFGLFFAPETSTANRAMIGGMVGNNSCGSNSVVYRSTREHLISVKTLLSDGSEATFEAISLDEFHNKCEGNTLEASIYRHIRKVLSNYDTQQDILHHFPKPEVERRNTGYAVDLLLNMAPFMAGGPDFNFCTLLAGSEGTLALITEITLQLQPLPPKETGLVCVHFNTIDEALRANLIALSFQPSASELIDHYILDCTKENIEQSKNRFFVQGDPGAILVIEFCKETQVEINAIAAKMEAAMRNEGLGFHFPLLFGNDTKKIWTLRKAGLGLLGNLPGDEKAVAVIEDTAVAVHDLPAYIREFNAILSKYGLYSVHYAHAGSGELHLRPILNLKTAEGQRLYRVIAEEIALLVKKYRGSLSGEHGDGRLRGEFIPQMIGAKNYELLRQLKQNWDHHNIFNPGKIVDTPPMDAMLRYEKNQHTPDFKTIFRFTNQNILQHTEQCNGSGDCRKSEISGGTMCPSYMATRNEKDTTRARANILREFLTRSTKTNRYNHKEIYEVMDLCLSCKGCKSECPSNVDMAKLKAEWQQNWYDANGIPLRSILIAHFTALSKLGALFPPAYNWLITAPGISGVIKTLVGFAVKRSLPTLHTQTLRSWYLKKYPESNAFTSNEIPRHLSPLKKAVYFFCDEFTEFTDTSIGIKAIELLHKLGYQLIFTKHQESGRTWLSKGFLRKAKTIANQNIAHFGPLITSDLPLIGIEPSAILTFRDEYPDLANDELLETAKNLAKNTFTVEEFLAIEMKKGNITHQQFTQEERTIYLHGHCQQKALGSLQPLVEMLSLPINYKVEIIPSGCCGMAGSFGYEKEHYALSMQIGELVLFPVVRDLAHDKIIAAPGTSCRHQIKDGTGRKALHPVEILWQALNGSHLFFGD